MVLMTLIPSLDFSEASICVREMADLFLNRTNFAHSLDVVKKQA
jgi:hypothetical protein